MDSIQRNRVGMRYYRGVLGYYYDQIVRFGSHPRNPDDLGQFETDWRTELAEMQGLDQLRVRRVPRRGRRLTTA